MFILVLIARLDPLLIIADFFVCDRELGAAERSVAGGPLELDSKALWTHPALCRE